MADPTDTPYDEVPEQSEAPPGRRLRDLRMVGTGIATVLLVWFAVANLQEVRIRFWLTSATAPLIVVIAISGALGAVAAALISRVARRRRHPGTSN